MLQTYAAELLFILFNFLFHFVFGAFCHVSWFVAFYIWRRGTRLKRNTTNASSQFGSVVMLYYDRPNEHTANDKWTATTLFSHTHGIAQMILCCGRVLIPAKSYTFVTHALRNSESFFNQFRLRRERYSKRCADT